MVDEHNQSGQGTEPRQHAVSVGTWRELLAAAAHDGTIVGADVISSSEFLYPRSGYVTYLQADKQECNIAGRTVWLPNLVRLRFPDGRVFENPAALAKHEQLMAEREASKQEVQRLQSTTASCRRETRDSCGWSANWTPR